MAPIRLDPFRRIVGVGWGVGEPPTEFGDIVIQSVTQDLPSFIGSVAKQESGYRRGLFFEDDLGDLLGDLGGIIVSDWWQANRGDILRASILWESFEGDPNEGNATFTMIYNTLDPEGGEPFPPEILPGIGFQIIGSHPFAHSTHVYGEPDQNQAFYSLQASPVLGAMILSIGIPDTPVLRTDARIGTLRLRFINETP